MVLEIIEESEIIEVKQGPYDKELDKERFNQKLQVYYDKKIFL